MDQSGSELDYGENYSLDSDSSAKDASEDDTDLIVNVRSIADIKSELIKQHPHLYANNDQYFSNLLSKILPCFALFCLPCLALISEETSYLPLVSSLADDPKQRWKSSPWNSLKLRFGSMTGTSYQQQFKRDLK